MKPATVIQILEKLVKPSSDVSVLSLEEALTKKLNSCRLDASSTEHRTYSPDLTFASHRQCLKDFAWWKFTESLVHCLLDLERSLATSSGEDKLLSVNQKKTIVEALELVVAFGVLAHLSEGVGLPMEQRSTTSQTLVVPQTLNPLQKCLSVEYVGHSLLLLMEEETLKSIICSRHLGDLFAAIFTVLLFKDEDSMSFKQEFDLTKKDFYKRKLSEILEKTYQPLVIRELMLLLGNKKCPVRLSRALRGLLTERLMTDGGVSAILKSITGISGAQETPRNSATADLIARLIMTPHIKDQDAYYRQICPTVISLLTSDNRQYAQICVLCIKHLYESKSEVCEQYFLDSLFGALKKPTCEEEMGAALERLYTCFAIPGSDLWSVPLSALLPHAGVLFRLHYKIVASVSSVKSKVEELVWKCFCLEDFDRLKNVLIQILFGDCDISFCFGERGGVYSTLGEDSFNAEDASDQILDLLNKRDPEGKVKTLMFRCLIDIFTAEDNAIDIKLVATKMLSVLSSDPDVLKLLNSDPTPIVEFLLKLLENKSTNIYDSSITGLGLMVLGAILSDTRSAAHRDWKLFGRLLEPLKKLKTQDSLQSDDLKILADEIYCMILTHGIAGSVLKPPSSATGDEEQPKIQEVVEGEFVMSECSKALDEACNPLLPVRAQALRKLAKLVLAKDPHARAKKEAILCIFKENLKDEDSYMYLSAIEGLASIATVYPNEVLLALTEQYIYTKESQLRLKVGEVLIRVITDLDELVYNYKAELLNAFLYGCRDPDPLVRASSLSNLGKLCQVLTFRIGVFIVEIFDCVESIVETDKAPEARRAALMLVTLVLKGLGTSALSVLEAVLLKMYRGLMKAYRSDKDDVCRLHAQLALEEINCLMKDVLIPQQTLTKRIHVLHPPP